MTLAQTLGTFVAQFPTSDLPALALERAKMSVASTFSSAAMGVSIESARIIREIERSLVPHGTSSLWFEAGRLPVDRAARVNTTPAWQPNWVFRLRCRHKPVLRRS